MKIELIRRSKQGDYVCYGARLKDRPNKLWKIYIPHNVAIYPPERFIAFVSLTDVDETKHTCRKCGKTYPKFKYAEHAKRHTN